MSLNADAKEFFPEYIIDELVWYIGKMEEFKRMNTFIFDEEDDMRYILSFNIKFERVPGRRINIRKFSPTLQEVKEKESWVEVAMN